MSRWPPACLPAGALIAGAFLAPRLAIAPEASLLVALAALGLVLRGPTGIVVAAGALGLLRAEEGWVAPLRASAGWELERPLEATFEPDDRWELLDDSWAARGRLRQLTQDGRSERLDLAIRVVVTASPDPGPVPRGVAPPALPGRAGVREPAAGSAWTAVRDADAVGRTAVPPFTAASYRLRGYLRTPLVFHNGDPTWTGGWQLRVKSARFVIPLAVARPLGGPARARDRLVAGLGAASERGPGAALLEGLLLGRTSALPEDWQRGLRRTGLAHLFAVSGLHVSLIAGVVWATTGWLRAPVRGGAALLVAAAYSLLVGLGPTVLRSTWMLAAMIGARLARRRPSSLNALALSAGGLVAASPALVDDLAFQLTVAATAGVVGLGPWLAARWGHGPVATALATCVGAQLATLPFTVPAFSLLPLLGAALNLVAVPWTGLCLVLGLGWAVVALVEPNWAAALVPWFDPLAHPFGWLATLPAHALVSAPLALGVTGCSALAAGVLALAARPRRLLLLAPLLALLVAPPRSRDFELTMLDVGQGDAILLRDRGRAILVDGGGWPGGDLGGRVLLPALARLGIRALDAAVVSHPDTDHCAGLADLAAYIPIEELWIAPGWGDAPCLRRLLADRAHRVRVLWRGDRVTWRRWSFLVLHPSPGERGAGNDRSLVLEARAGGRSLLLTGDIPERVETAMVRRRVLRPVDLLKVAHHGSRTSTSLPFLSSITPRWALISAGRANAYGHPSDAALQRLARRGTAVLRTDLNGRVRLRWRPEGPLRVEVSRAPVLGDRGAGHQRLGPPRLVFETLAPLH